MQSTEGRLGLGLRLVMVMVRIRVSDPRWIVSSAYLPQRPWKSYPHSPWVVIPDFNFVNFSVSLRCGNAGSASLLRIVALRSVMIVDGFKSFFSSTVVNSSFLKSVPV